MRVGQVLQIVLFFAAIPAAAAPVSNIEFTAATDYTGNFVGTLNGAVVAFNGAGQNVVYTPTANAQTAIIRYDTNPGDAQPGPADFLNETLKVDATLSALDGSSFGMMTRIQTSDGTGVLALLNANSATSIQVRLFYGAGTATNAAGTTFYTGNFNLSTGAVSGGGTGSTNAIAPGAPLTFTLTQTAAADPVFNLTIADADGLVASTGNQTLTASNAYDGPGSVALRMNDFATGDTIAVDNFSATPTPEPGTIGLAAWGALGMLASRRRRRPV
jgi:MYXO-CTERM domain-containing protein